MSAKSKASKSDNVVALVSASKRTSFQILSSSVATLRAEAAVSNERWKRRTKKLRKEIAALKEQKAALADLLTKKLVEQARAKANPKRITIEQSLKIALTKRGKRGSNKAKIRPSLKKAINEAFEGKSAPVALQVEIPTQPVVALVEGAYATLDTTFTGKVIQDTGVEVGVKPSELNDALGRGYPRKLSHPELWNEVATQNPTLTESQINKRVADRSRSKRNRKQG